MATQSIMKNIVIHDSKSATAFVEALEKAATLSGKPVAPDYTVNELKDAEHIKAFLEDCL